MSGWQSQQYDPRQPQRWGRPDYVPAFPPQQHERQRAAMEPYAPQAPRPNAPRKTSLTAAEKFWYVMGNIAFGAAYFAKIPAKKALADFGMAELTPMEGFWYVLMCIAFGAGYFAKISTAKAVSEMPQFRR